MTELTFRPMRTMMLTYNSILPMYKHCPFDGVTLTMFNDNDQLGANMCHVIILHDPDTGRTRYLKNAYGPTTPTRTAIGITDMHDGDIWLLTEHDPTGEPTTNVQEFLVDAVIDDTAIVVDQRGNVYSWQRGEERLPICAVCGKDLDDEIEPDCDCEIYYHPDCCPDCNDTGSEWRGLCELDGDFGDDDSDDDSDDEPSKAEQIIFVGLDWQPAEYPEDRGNRK